MIVYQGSVLLLIQKKTYDVRAHGSLEEDLSEELVDGGTQFVPLFVGRRLWRAFTINQGHIQCDGLAASRRLKQWPKPPS